MSLRSAAAERRQKTASSLANGAVTDYFRQFSQDVYSGHYDAASLSRPKSFYSAGYSTVTFIPDATPHGLPAGRRSLRHRGQEGDHPGAGSPGAVLLRPRQYGTMINGIFTIGASNVVYDGGFRSTAASDRVRKQHPVQRRPRGGQRQRLGRGVGRHRRRPLLQRARAREPSRSTGPSTTTSPR